MSFKVDGKHVFLTYPQCDIAPQRFWEHLQSLGAAWIRVACEHHQDGSPHRHVAVGFHERCQKGRKAFIIDGKSCNIGNIRNITAAMAYCCKEEHFDFGNVPAKYNKRDWASIESAAAGDERNWLRVCHEERIQPHVAKRLREIHNSTSRDLSDYDNRPIQQQLDTVPTEYESICVVGDPGIGKTGWAMKHAPRPALLVRHLDMLKHFNSNYHKSLVFDDCDFRHLPRSTQLQLAGYHDQAQIHIRYGVAEIPSRTPRIFLCNPGNEPFLEDNAIQNRRVKYYYV